MLQNLRFKFHLCPFQGLNLTKKWLLTRFYAARLNRFFFYFSDLPLRPQPKINPIRATVVKRSKQNPKKSELFKRVPQSPRAIIEFGK